MGHIWVTPAAQLGLWTLRPRFLQRFVSPRSLFHTRQRFPLSNHVTSGCLSPRSLFSNWSAVSHPKPRDFRLYEPAIPFSHSPAVSPFKSRDFRLSEPTIPFFPTGQRFPLPNHVTSGCMSPRSLFSHWSAVSHPTSGHDVTRPIRSQSGGHLGALYY